MLQYSGMRLAGFGNIVITRPTLRHKLFKMLCSVSCEYTGNSTARGGKELDYSLIHVTRDPLNSGFGLYYETVSNAEKTLSPTNLAVF